MTTKALEWRVWYDGKHSKCGRFLIEPEGNMFRLTHATPNVKLDRLDKQSWLYMSMDIAMSQAETLHKTEILSWLEK